MTSCLPWLPLVGFVLLSSEPSAGMPAPHNQDPQELARLMGRWSVIRIEQSGYPTTCDPEGRCAFEEDRLTVHYRDGNQYSYRLGMDQTPRTIDLVMIGGAFAGQTVYAIYVIHDDLLIICANYRGEPKRPTAFTTTANDDVSLMVFRRETE